MLLLDDLGRERPVEAILFDMDGTLVDSVAASERAWQTWAAVHGVADRLRITHGQPVEATILATIPEVDHGTLAAHVAEQREREAGDLADVAPLAGSVDLLRWLDGEGIPWIIVTSADINLARARLGAAGITPPLIVTRDDVTHGKPHPEPFALGAQRVGVVAERCLVVEDTQVGVDSGRGAGAVTAGIGALQADLVVDDIPHLHRRLVAARA